MTNRPPRHGSLQFYPRVRAKKILPKVNWKYLQNKQKEVNLLGFIGYKVGMMSAYVRDLTPNSLTKNQRIVIPVTILECPPMKILSVRFYNKGKVIGEVLNSNLDKELKRKIKIPKKTNLKIEDFKKEFDDIRVIVYSVVKKTKIKKTPDIHEIGISGNLDEKLEFVKKIFNKEISIKDVFKEGLVDIRGVTKGKGTQGIVKRFGVSLRPHKAEKGQRVHGSGGPWNPPRIDFRFPMAGQMGFHTRVNYNNKIIKIGNINEENINPSGGFKNYGIIKCDYLVVSGSIQGPQKRAVLITYALRPSKKQLKKNYEFIELR